MTPKEKARGLIDTMSDSLYHGNGTGAGAVACAKIAVNEIIADFKSWRLKPWISLPHALEAVEYWEEVKIELENLNA